MRRFFVKVENIVGASVIITDDEAYHITKVLRLSPGTSIIVCDGEGYDYESKITELRDNKVLATILGVKKTDREPRLRVLLAQGLSKKSMSFEFVVQKATELGVSHIVPLLTERTVIKENSRAGFIKRQKRWQRIALEAAKQSQRGRVPEIGFPTDLQSFLERLPRDTLCLIPWEEEDSTTIGEVLKWERNNNYRRPVAIFIGPEGGFSLQEVDNARRSGAVTVSLGPRILRTETAGIIALGIVLYELDDLGGAKCAQAENGSARTWL